MAISLPFFSNPGTSRVERRPRLVPADRTPVPALQALDLAETDLHMPGIGRPPPIECPSNGGRSPFLQVVPCSYGSAAPRMRVERSVLRRMASPWSDIDERNLERIWRNRAP